jgi:DNA primase
MTSRAAQKINLSEDIKNGDGRVDTSIIRSRTSITAIASRFTQLRRTGEEMKGLCPLHEENTASFFVNETKGTFFCFGCGAGGDVIELYRSLHGVGFLDACTDLIAFTPLVSPGEEPQFDRRALREMSVDRARDEWHRAGPIAGTPAQTYLESRGVGHDVPVSIRFGMVPRYWRDDGHEGPRQPAMIAAAQDVSGRIVGIQRTFLDADGRKWTKGEARLSLGRMRGSALRLGPARPKIMLACAVEDALSLRLMFPGATVWSAFGDANMPFVRLPKEVAHVVLCGDADESGQLAVAAATEALETAAVITSHLFPHIGKDFNEELQLREA